LRHAQDELAATLRNAQDELTTMLRHAQDAVQGVNARQDDVVQNMAVLRVAVDGVVRRQDDVVRAAETLDGTMAGLVKRQDDLVQVTQATFTAHNARANDIVKLQEELAPQVRGLMQHVHETDAERHQMQDAAQQQMHDVARTCDTVEHHVTDVLARQNDVVQQLALVTEKVGEVAQQCAALQHETQGVTRRQDALVSSTEQMTLQLTGALQSSGAVGERIATAEKGFEALRDECERMREQTGAVRSAVQLVLDALHGPADARTLPRTAVKECALRMSDAVYLAFEDAYRGDETTITQRLERYLAIVKHCVTSPRDRILDLGCGRGEFVGLLEQHGMLAHGVDSNRHAVARARKHGLAVKHGDLFAELAHARDNSYAALAAFHVIEHLPFAQTAHLLRLAFKKLKPGGVLLLETPNILSLRVAASEFHKDPTHVCPVHPATLEYWLGQTGFTAVAVAYLNPFSSAESSGLLHAQLAPGTHDILRTLDACIFGCRDCSVAAYKPQPKEIKP
ncbi:MAG: methyltransferase domain-containing protein, partial [bacterium]|nr:methyltransferase domain-containing protein [bacterium]